MSDLKLPNLIIGGVHKAGTTSVYTYLSQHPEICASLRKEIGFFMPLRYGKSIPPLDEYALYFIQCASHKKYRLEASPSYMYGVEKIGSVLKKELKNLKLIIILRDPVDRLNSFFESEHSNGFLPVNESFNEFILKSFDYSKLQNPERTKENELYIRGFDEGLYVKYLPYWIDAFGDDLKIIFYEELKNDSVSFMKDVCDWLEIDFSFYKPEDFIVENKTLKYKNRKLHGILYKLYMNMEWFWRKNVFFKRMLRTFYRKLNASSDKRSLSEQDRKHVESLYAQSNLQLKVILLKAGYKSLPEWLLNS